MKRISPADRTEVPGWIYVAIAGIAAVVVAFIARAVRLTRASIALAAPSVPFSQPDAVLRAADRLRTLDVRCPHCGNDTVTIPGTRNRYRCDDGCDFEFEGPEHISTAGPASAHPPR